MAEVIRFVARLNGVGTPVNTQAIFWKERWADAWEAAPLLWCQEATWCLAPSLPTAQLVFRYGSALEIGARTFARRARLDKTRWYVRVDYTDFPFAVSSDGDGNPIPTTRSWYGLIDAQIDEQLGQELEEGAGVVTGYPRGRNYFLAYGLEAILATSWIDRSAVKVGGSGAGDQEQFVPRALAINPGLADYNPDPAETTGEGNRSESAGPSGQYIFHNRRSGGKTWSTHTAVDYELHYSPARNYSDEQPITFCLEDTDAALPTWDTPILQRERRSVYEVLNLLMARQRCLAWRCEVRESPSGATPAKVAIVPCTFLADAITTDDGNELKANPHQKTLAFEKDRGAESSIKTIASDQVDQVIAQGERRTSTATFSYIDETLVIGWAASLETRLEEGASTAGDYPASTEIDKRCDLNWFCRQMPIFAPVYARHTLPTAPTGKVGIGTDGPGTANIVLMPSDADDTTPTPWAPDDQRFLPYTAFLEGFEYQDDVIDSGNVPEANDLKPHRYQKPLVLFPRTNLDEDDTTERYRHAEKGPGPLAQGEDPDPNRGWTAQVRIDDDDGALWVTLSNHAQFLMAKTDFTRLTDAGEPADEDFVGDYRDMLVTATVPWSQYAEARYPKDAPYGSDYVRRMRILVPYHRVDYVVAETVVGLNEKTGELLRTDTGGYIRDDRQKLQQIARVAYEWYGKLRQAIGFSTTLVNNIVQLGDLIVSVGDPDLAGDMQTEDINSVVSVVRIVSPLAEDGEPPLPRIEYQTAFGELDVLKFVERPRQR